MMSGDIFKKIELVIKMGRKVEERIREGKLTIPDDVKELKNLIKEKANLLAYEEGEDELVKVEKTDSDFDLVCDLLTLLYALEDKLEG